MRHSATVASPASTGSGLSEASVRLLFWNTWLLRPRWWPGGPALPFQEKFSVGVRERAPAVGRALCGRFDVCALAECFEPSEQQAVLRAWDGRPVAAVRGPGRRFPRITGSGLLTVVDGLTVRRTASWRFRAGRDLRDSDTYASKGVVLASLDLGPARPGLDVFSTHLMAGADLFPLPGADDHARHHRTRLAQLDELVAFVAAERDPANAAVLLGDFNIEAHDRVTGAPTPEYADLLAKLAPAGFVDVWATHGVGLGVTSLERSVKAIDVDPAEPDALLDSPAADGDHAGVSSGPAVSVAGHRSPPKDRPSGGRIDYVWLAQPCVGSAEADRPRRWAFVRDLPGGPAGCLSDHLALSTTISVSR